jgi:predicted outer membrane lipoprotein
MPECDDHGSVGTSRMNLSWIFLTLLAWAFGLLFVLALAKMSGDQDRAARHEEKRLDPHSDVTITRFGNG